MIELFSKILIGFFLESLSKSSNLIVDSLRVRNQIFTEESVTDPSKGPCKIFKFCFQLINALIKAEIEAEIPFKLFLQGSQALCEINYDNCENITYEFISQVISNLQFLFVLDNLI